MDKTTLSWRALILLPLLAIVLGLLTYQKELSTNGDNGGYICLAKSLAQGHGLRFINDPDQPKSDQFPMGFPFFLSFVIRCFGFHLLLLQLAMVGLWAVLILLFYLLAARFLQGAYLWSALFLTLSNFWLLDSVGAMMSEPLFTALLLGGILFFLRYLESGNPFSLAMAALLLMATVFVRTAGVASLLALLAILFYRRKMWPAIIMIAVFILFYLWHKAQMADSGGYGRLLLLKDPYAPHLGLSSPLDLLKRVWDNGSFYLSQVIQMTLLSFMEDMGGLSPSSFIVFSVSLISLLLFYPPKRALASHPDLFLLIFLVFYAGILLLWPRVWSGSRFLIPLIPILYMMLLRNLSYASTAFLHPDIQPRFGKLMLGIMLLFSLLNFGEAFRKSRMPLTEDWIDYYRAAEWAKTHTDTTAVFCTRSPYLFYLKSDRKSVSIPLTPNPDSVMAYCRIKRVTHVVLDRFAWSNATLRYILPARERYAARFESLRPPQGDRGSEVLRIR
ncbi:MAG: hypothetical protein A2293_02755 [Elusimicrobia bacterium RIFOXYB2_FULL_49_7]|nr:MAG: hypothetical protein A2293_02755 [Elusimicrobia bacterium RIFOXYB2_FULL_49_7]